MEVVGFCGSDAINVLVPMVTTDQATICDLFAIATVVNSLIVSKVDYCNSLLAACTQQQTHKVQRVLNCAARVILGGSKYDHVTPLIRDDLHWLRVPEHITFKLCLSTRHCTAWLQSTSSRCVYQSRHPRQDHRCAQR